MKRYTLMFIIALAAASPALAASAGSADTRRLHETDAKLTARASATKGGQQQRLLLQRARVRQLIDDIRSGKAVDAPAIDRALLDADQQ